LHAAPREFRVAAIGNVAIAPVSACQQCLFQPSPVSVTKLTSPPVEI
jgi:hypothetical protein